ncbi:hypothetical protein RF11_08518 [Thelohanellus kitauei]|uniref:Tc1-like transposase DDE domain-containing protein n=1 Tax=Thelohanellus kitauei TaxID=669202 RepID=A0A0C2IXF6_THEKT|nr:hypothetical protein RF11_08518 [Thelohanellus kitauei]
MITYIEKNPGESFTKVAEISSINKRTLAKIHEKYMATGEIEEDKRRGARGTKVNQIHYERIDEAIEENPTVTLKEIKIALLQEFNLMVTEKTISRVISKLEITYKLTRLVPISRNTEETIQKLYDNAYSFFEVYLDFITRPLHMSDDAIYIDETGFNLHLRRKFGRSPSGKRVAITVSS